MVDAGVQKAVTDTVALFRSDYLSAEVEFKSCIDSAGLALMKSTGVFKTGFDTCMT